MIDFLATKRLRRGTRSGSNLSLKLQELKTWPVTLGDLVRPTVVGDCCDCGHERDVNMAPLPAEMPVT